MTDDDVTDDDVTDDWDDEEDRSEEGPEQARTARWSAEGWLFWLEPDERSWWWWDGRADGPDHLVVEVLTRGHPYGDGSLRWMLRAAGCTDLHEDGRPVGAA